MERSDLLRVTHIRAERLFDRYDHEVALRLDDRVTIIHGPNGVGKTALLRLAFALLSGGLPEMTRVPFRRFEVTLSDGARLGFEKPDPQADQQASQEFVGTFYLKRASGEEHQSRILEMNLISQN